MRLVAILGYGQDMRGIGRGIARLPVAAVVLTGAFTIAKLPTQGAFAQTATRPVVAMREEEEVAAAVIRHTDRSARPAEMDLPMPLPGGEAARLRRIFRLQAAGDVAGAARVAADLADGSPLGQAMFGHVLADRYLNPATHPGVAALADWLARWPDLPDAPALYRLLLARLPGGAAPPPGLARPPGLPAPPDEDDATENAPRRNPELDRDVYAVARARGAAGVRRLLARTSGLTPAYAALLRGEAARILFTLNRDGDALALAAGPPATEAALAGFAGGLSAWRLGRIATARALFAAGFRAPVATPDLRAGCAFWAARAALRQGEGAAYFDWMRRAAEQGDRFYALLARRRLGLGELARLTPGERATLGTADVAAVAATAPGERAFALLQIGQPARAEAELRLLLPQARDNRALARAVMLVAARARLGDTAVAFADVLANGEIARPAPPVKLPPLHPAGGFTVDPAMVYGIARTESNFDPAMVSSAGARGILQIMPETARDMLGRPLGRAAALLANPEFNLDLGQRYIVFLAGQEPVNGDLIRLIASYNAGLGNFARWSPTIRDQGDPLLFIEAIPIDETRAYVPRVLTYTWLYAARLHLPAPSLDELAAGLWPRYHPRESQQGDAGWRASTKVAASSP